MATAKNETDIYSMRKLAMSLGFQVCNEVDKNSLDGVVFVVRGGPDGEAYFRSEYSTRVETWLEGYRANETR